VADGSITGGADLVQLELLGFIPPGCSPQFPVSPAAVTAGDIVLTDGSKNR
jgi:hypothetical protein